MAYAAGTGVMTGYYEPVLRGATAPTDVFQTPLLAPPAELNGRAAPVTTHGVFSDGIADRSIGSRRHNH